MKPLAIAALVLLALPFLAACEGGNASAVAPEAKPVAILNLTVGTDDPHRAWMALRLADHFVTAGRETIVFLNVTGPVLASTKLGDVKFEDKPAYREIVADLLKRGAKVLVCPECAEKVGVGKEDLVPGAEFASAESLFGPMNQNTVVFSY
jgi:predicted peroxiredoxin